MYLPGSKVPSVVIAAEMQMFPIDQVIIQGWPLLQAILKPGPQGGPFGAWWSHGGRWERGGGEAGIRWYQGGKGGEKGKKKKEKKEKKEKKKTERLAKGSNGVTPSKWAPSLGPGPLTSKKVKISVSKLRPKTPLVTQKAKFGIDVGLTPSESIKVYHPLAGPPPWSIPQVSAIDLIATPVNRLLDARPGPSSDPKDQIIKALEVCVASLEKQVERIPNLELQLSSMAWVIEALWEQVQGQLATHSFPTLFHRSLALPVLVSHQMQRLQLEMANSHLKSDFIALEAKGQPSSHLSLQLVSPSADGGKSAPSPLHLHMHQQPHLGVEMEDDTSGDTSDDNAGPPLPIPPPFRPGTTH
ncbi:hypothetical protein PAXRUDRAFT_19746 [Paxillus rubicundulus Ve08.2h10]|uniref:Unplaced genomic scaffold scaffold_3924, whole genome shotgun sequence n=1 Tax=Paxillus rubicundulus Ve08.2h10 TaxID=930991 RepID=A0A0D0D3Q0_9AGAM|nr:hypothetical protein PAXRUDRAFT_19746 [Paxillus rubicundulus Ve08.2h10]